MTKTVSLETAKKLNEAGWPQVAGCGFDESFPHDECMAAPDVSELLEALPEETTLLKAIDGYHVSCSLLNRRPSDVKFDSNPAEALAHLWLELRAKNII